MPQRESFEGEKAAEEVAVGQRRAPNRWSGTDARGTGSMGSCDGKSKRGRERGRDLEIQQNMFQRSNAHTRVVTRSIDLTGTTTAVGP